jgi:para-nitrobenzyl esterase
VEIQYLFDNLHVDGRAWTPADRQLASRLADTVIQFASTGAPTGKGLPAWPVFNGTPATMLRIGSEAELKEHPLPDFTLFPKVGD